MSNVWTCDVNVFIVNNVDKLSVLIPQNCRTIRGYGLMLLNLYHKTWTQTVIKTPTKRKKKKFLSIPKFSILIHKLWTESKPINIFLIQFLVTAKNLKL